MTLNLILPYFSYDLCVCGRGGGQGEIISAGTRIPNFRRKKSNIKIVVLTFTRSLFVEEKNT